MGLFGQCRFIYYKARIFSFADMCVLRYLCPFCPYSTASSFSFSFGFSRLGVATADNLHFYSMAFLFLRSDALPATSHLFRGKIGPPVFHILTLQHCNKIPSLRKSQHKTITISICKAQYRESKSCFCRYAGNKTNSAAKLGTLHHK